MQAGQRKCRAAAILAFGFLRLVCAVGRRPSAMRLGDGAAQPHRQRSRRLFITKRTHYSHLIEMTTVFEGVFKPVLRAFYATNRPLKT